MRLRWKEEMERFGVPLVFQPQPPPANSLKKDEVHVQVEIDKEIMGKGIGLTWDEAKMQVALAQMEYQLPQLTKMWTHLKHQSGGQVKGMHEKQIEVDKRILRTQIGVLKKELESVRKHIKQYKTQRISVPVPVVSLVGYTNAGKSTLLNQFTGANVRPCGGSIICYTRSNHKKGTDE